MNRRPGLIGLLVLVALLLSAHPVQAQTTTWTATYFDNQFLGGPPVLEQEEQQILYDWGYSRPYPEVPDNFFSARWVTQATFKSASYTFFATSDDGVRVYLDGKLIIDDWVVPHQVRTAWVEVPVTAGTHEVKVDYYEKDRAALIHVWWGLSTDLKGGEWLLEVWNGEKYETLPALVQLVPEPNFDWGFNPPGSGVNADNFVTRVSTYMSLPAGTWAFNAGGDEGVRLWISGILLIDAWGNGEQQVYTEEVELKGAPFVLQLETREQGGIAAISLSWKLVADLQGNPIDDGLESSQGGVPGGLPPEQNPGAIVVDWPSRNFLRGGPGKFWNLIQGGYSGNFWRTPNRQYNTQDYSYARWYPQVGPRRYEIYVYIPNLANVTTSATYYVHSQDGYQFVKINQRANQGKWVSLGTYNFLGYYSEFDEKISLSSVTGEPDQSTFVAWDGLQAVPR